MIKYKEQLADRVNARKEALADERAKLNELRDKVTALIEDFKGRSVIYGLIKNLPIWKEIEKLIDGGGPDAT